MLKGIPPILSPDLLKALMEMGHGDEIVIADGHFPAAAMAKRLIRLDGHGVPEVLEAVLKYLPLDDYVEKPATLMSVVSAGDGYVSIIQETYKSILTKSGNSNKDEVLERSAFYERAKNAYAIVATSEKSKYANIILKKGLVEPE